MEASDARLERKFSFCSSLLKFEPISLRGALCYVERMTPAVTPLNGWLFGAGQPCFGCGPDHPSGFRLAFEMEGDEVVTRFTPGPTHQGPLRLMHGGLISTLADETAAWVVLARLGKFGFTTKFEARFVKGVRVGVEAVARGRMTKHTSRIVHVRVLISQEQDPCFEGDFTFVLLDQSGAERLMGGPLPDEWLKYCR
jgi:acyl-coenzyme A thioesterase PaaI-like protein